MFRRLHLISRGSYCAHFLFALAVTLVHPHPQALLAQSANREGFVLSGTVVNSITGEGISRALVRLSGQVQRSGFTDPEGHFQFEGIPAGQVVLIAQKPGYFNDTDLSGSAIPHVMVGSSTGSQTVKLTPQGAIFGRLTDASGQPVEHLNVRLTARALRDGQTSWEPRGMSSTDDDGHFRFANLMPGAYYLSAGPGQLEDKILVAGEKPRTGFPHLYYPGAPDLSGAAPLQLSGGQQVQADFVVNPVLVYQVSGAVTGQPPGQGFGLMTMTPSGDDLMLPASINGELGTFQMESVPAGTYTLRAVAGGVQQLVAEQKINVAANLENVHLALAPMLSIPVTVHLSSSSGASNSRRPGPQGDAAEPKDSFPLTVSLQSSQPSASGAYSTIEQHDGRSVMLLQNVSPGTYSVRVTPHLPWYVQSANYGQTNVLSDDILVSPGQSYPLDVTLRDDSASLSLSVRGLDSGPGAARVACIIVPQTSSRHTPIVLNGINNGYTQMGLAPGDYLVFAFDHIDGLEYANPDALDGYASQGAHVSLSGNQQAQVTLDLIHRSKEE